MKSIAFRRVSSGEVLNLHMSMDHQFAKPEKPVWVDESGSYIAKVSGRWNGPPKGFVRVGSKEDKLFHFRLAVYKEFKMFLKMIDQENPVNWPEGNDKLTFPGLPAYKFKLAETLEGGSPRLLIIFARKIVLPEGEINDRFLIGNRPAIDVSKFNDIQYYPYF